MLFLYLIGNWSHTTHVDVQKGIQPEFPLHAAMQLDFRKRFLASGRKIVAVSDFIADEMQIQWGFDSTVINNGIDLEQFKPCEKKLERKRPLIIHFTTTDNKGLDHIVHLRNNIDADVLLLDEAAIKLSIPKYEALAQADLVVHPSAHEGNSYAVLETLASGIPLVVYDTGLMWKLKKENANVGIILNRNDRNIKNTIDSVKFALNNLSLYNPIEVIKNYSIQKFHIDWKEYIKKEFNIVI